MRMGLDQEPGESREGSTRKGMSNAEWRDRQTRAMQQQHEEKRQRIRDTAPRMHAIRFGTLALGVIASVGLIVYNASASSSHSDQVSVNAERISDLSSDLRSSEQDEQSVRSVDAVMSSLDSARSAGEGLMGVQNRMRELRMAPDDDAAWDADLAAYSEMTDEAKNFMVASATDSGDFMANGQWFIGYNVGADAEGDSAVSRMPVDQWAWRMEPVGMNTDGTGDVPVIWRASYTGGENDGVDLAWVTATYHQDSGKFSGFTRGITVEGTRHIAMSISDDPEVNNRDFEEKAPNDGDDLDRIARETLEQAQRSGGSQGTGGGEGADDADDGETDDDPRVAGNQSAEDFQNGGNN